MLPGHRFRKVDWIGDLEQGFDFSPGDRPAGGSPQSVLSSQREPFRRSRGDFAVRKELEKALQNPEKVPLPLKRFIANLPGPDPIKNFVQNLKSNRILRS
jgi:hypothetical protein